MSTKELRCSKTPKKHTLEDARKPSPSKLSKILRSKMHDVVSDFSCKSNSHPFKADSQDQTVTVVTAI